MEDILETYKLIQQKTSLINFDILRYPVLIQTSPHLSSSDTFPQLKITFKNNIIIYNGQESFSTQLQQDSSEELLIF